MDGRGLQRMPGFHLAAATSLLRAQGEKVGEFWGTPLSFLSHGEHTLLSTE